jgi:O-Antigen ligase
MSATANPLPAKRKPWSFILAGFSAAWVTLVMVKFGNPVIFDELVASPTSGLEFMFNPWPLVWGYGLLIVFVVLSMSVWRWNSGAPRWQVVLPLVWYGWQCLSATQTVDSHLTQVTLAHFTACVACFYIGLFALSQVKNLLPFGLGFSLGLAWVVWMGMEQHYGGLEQTRREFEQIKWEEHPPELRKRLDTIEMRKKIASDRIFSTFVYPNALAGAIILFLPVALAALWKVCERCSFVIRGVLVSILGYSGLACLYWSGSKAGWLIVLAMGSIVFFGLRIKKQIKWWLAMAVLVGGLGGFCVKYSSYFTRGATSAVARFDYWRAAVEIMKENPVLGSGPGTFLVGYRKLKAPEAEMARLAHNDYLQQGSDSGLAGLVSYLGLTAGSVGLLYGASRRKSGLVFSLWLGVCGLAIQEIVEFSLYIPALSWPFFLILGFLWGTRRNQIDNRV